MKSRKEILAEFSEMGSRHYFEMNSGRECEGWIVAIEDDHVLYIDCDPNGAKDEIKVRYAAVDVGSLAYRDDDKRCWMSARWDENTNNWIFDVLSEDEELETLAQHATKGSKFRKLVRFWKPANVASSLPPVVPPASLNSHFSSVQ